MPYLQRLLKTLCIYWLTLTLLSCSSANNERNTQASNTLPIANAGIDQLSPLGSTIFLDGSNSQDEDNDPLSYHWIFSATPPNSQAMLTGASSFNPRFVADLSGDYVVTLIVSDSVSNSLSDSITISVTENNIPPFAKAGADQTIATGNEVFLDGGDSFDPNHDALSFQWSITSAPSTSNATLENSDKVMTNFTPDRDGRYRISLVVNDGDAVSTPDEIIITSIHSNASPIANAGPDQNLLTGFTAILDGRESTDPDNEQLTYLWTNSRKPSGSEISITDANSNLASVMTDIDGVYEFILNVSDGQQTHSDSTRITSTSINVPPIANAGKNQQVITGTLVTLDGSASRDEDNDLLHYNWQLASTPENSAATLNLHNTPSPTFVTDIDGIYLAQLTVSDGTTTSPIDSVSVTSATKNTHTIDTFDGHSPLLTTINNELALPEITKSTGRYHANLTNNTHNITLHYHQAQGRLDATLVDFPFEFIARNIGIGEQNNSQHAPENSGTPYIFAGVQVHTLELESPNSSHVVVGHRGNTGFTIEGKNTLNGNSSVNDIGENTAPLGRADIRIVGNIDQTLMVYWQQPNLSPAATQDNWQLYNSDGNLPGPAPIYDQSVYIGLITYASGNTGVPFVGTCDSIEIYQN